MIFLHQSEHFSLKNIRQNFQALITAHQSPENDESKTKEKNNRFINTHKYFH